MSHHDPEAEFNEEHTDPDENVDKAPVVVEYNTQRPATRVAEPQPAVEGRMTHPAMTWQEEVEWADKCEEDADRLGLELTEHEQERIRIIRETADAHAAIEKARQDEADAQSEDNDVR